MNQIRAMQAAKHTRVRMLEDELFRKGKMNEPPCFCCGYNGPGYYNPKTHPCAARHHALAPSNAGGKPRE